MCGSFLLPNLHSHHATSMHALPCHNVHTLPNPTLSNFPSPRLRVRPCPNFLTSILPLPMFCFSLVSLFHSFFPTATTLDCSASMRPSFHHSHFPVSSSLFSPLLFHLFLSASAASICFSPQLLPTHVLTPTLPGRVNPLNPSYIIFPPSQLVPSQSAHPECLAP